jgi:Fe-Mn family superoxide dismutase
MAFTLAPLPYAHEALEPHIDTLTMQIHHGKHHQAYVDNLNKAIAGSDNETKSIEELVKAAGSISPAVRNNGGGHWNHTFFWESLAPNAGGAPTGKLADAINEAFGSYDAFKEKFANAGMTRFGSGWAWLIVKDGKLEVSSTPNQDNPLMDVAEVNEIPKQACRLFSRFLECSKLDQSSRKIRSCLIHNIQSKSPSTQCLTGFFIAIILGASADSYYSSLVSRFPLQVRIVPPTLFASIGARSSFFFVFQQVLMSSTDKRKSYSAFLSGTNFIETEFTQWRVFFGVNPSPKNT